MLSALSVTTSVTLAESRTKLYRALRDESQFMHQLKSDVLFSKFLGGPRVVFDTS